VTIKSTKKKIRDAIEGLDLWRAMALLMSLGALVHAQALLVGYVADDFTILQAITEGRHADLLRDAFPAGRGTYFRPLVMFSLALEHAITTSPLLHHFINLAAHLAAGALVFAIGRALRSTTLSSFVAGLAFLVHPIVAYDVNWISGRTDVFTTLFALLSLWAFLTGRAGISIGALVLALASKEVAVVTPLCAVALSLLQQDETARKRRRGLLSTQAAITLGWLGLLYVRFYRSAPDPEAGPHLTSILKGLASVPILFVWPNSFWETRHLLLSYPKLLFVPALGLVVVGLLVARFVKKHPRERTRLLVLFALVTCPLLPLFAVGLVPSTRLMYFPLAMLCLGLATFPIPSHRAATPIIAALLLLMSIGSALRGRRWVENTQRLATYCDDMKALRQDAPSASIPVFVTMPFELDDTPLFVRHAHATLGTCLAARFASLDDKAVVIGPVVMPRSPTKGPVVSITRPSRSELHFDLHDGAFFGFEIPLERDVPVKFPEVTLRATAAANAREATGLTMTFPEDTIANADLLYFDGDHLKRVPAAP